MAAGCGDRRYQSAGVHTAIGTSGMSEAGTGLVSITDAQARAVKAVAEFGSTIVTETGQLARYIGRVLGTAPHDAVGLVVGDPLSFVRTAIAQTYDRLLNRILERRGITRTEAVSPSFALPLLRAAYDETRPELQQFWSELIAAAMDPDRCKRVRLSFIETVKGFDPLDAVVLRERHPLGDQVRPNATEYLVAHLERSRDEIEITIDNLERLKCVFSRPRQPPALPSNSVRTRTLESLL